ncbi:hypothetical protein PQX77_017688 [Marasmius sp. AFHP31]|nr:hypothetical protein PQX77_017688 [Marasmius sp. AFHP31]
MSSEPNEDAASPNGKKVKVPLKEGKSLRQKLYQQFKAQEAMIEVYKHQATQKDHMIASYENRIAELMDWNAQLEAQLKAVAEQEYEPQSMELEADGHNPEMDVSGDSPLQDALESANKQLTQAVLVNDMLKDELKALTGLSKDREEQLEREVGELEGKVASCEKELQEKENEINTLLARDKSSPSSGSSTTPEGSSAEAAPTNSNAPDSTASTAAPSDSNGSQPDGAASTSSASSPASPEASASGSTRKSRSGRSSPRSPRSPRARPIIWSAALRKVKGEYEEKLNNDQKFYFHKVALKVIETHYGLDQMAKFSAYEPMDPEIVAKYCRGQHAGPDKKAVMYFGPNFTSSPWNKKVLEILRELTLAELRELAEKEKNPPPTPPSEYLDAVMHCKMTTAASIWKTHQPQFSHQLGRIETQDEALARAGSYESETQLGKTARSARKYNRRVSICKQVIDGPNNDSLKVAQARRCQPLLKDLGIEGQSDEEWVNDEELNGTIMGHFKVYKASWRADSVSLALHALDREGDVLESQKVRGKSGAKPAPRRYVDKESGLRRNPPQKLHKPIYKKAFLEKCSKVQLDNLQVNDGPFDWD